MPLGVALFIAALAGGLLGAIASGAFTRVTELRETLDYCATYPPSTDHTAAVTKLAAAEAKLRIASSRRARSLRGL
ncbi:hypothetical protein AHIS1636_27450 [Arthrobacter mangrovi]|uniref:Secreted protein n=1 Tax=Arthrobacter mangrovi TaxID=2966350 RepID=A0ABQ5MWH1_9MICC|nr:hypothetical protein AHIS1636_27450 [Arthrobacter mangrovi]